MLGNAIAEEEFNLIPDTQFSEQIKTEKLIFLGVTSISVLPIL
jgi:hypothetical protein